MIFSSSYCHIDGKWRPTAFGRIVLYCRGTGESCIRSSHDSLYTPVFNTSNSGALMNLSITESGDTEYIFSESNNGNGCATLSFSEKSNWGITALISVSVGDHVIENIAQGALPAGAGKQRICVNCYLVTKIVKVRADCTSLSFCSHECMKKCASLLDDCGVLITTIRDWSANDQSFEINQYSDLAILAVVLLHKCKRRSHSRGLHNGAKVWAFFKHVISAFFSS